MAQNRTFRDGHHIGRSDNPALVLLIRWAPHIAVELMNGRPEMRKISLFAFSPALIAIGFGVWAASPAKAPVSPSIVQGIEPLQMMVNAKELPVVEFVDYTFVFAH